MWWLLRLKHLQDGSVFLVLTPSSFFFYSWSKPPQLSLLWFFFSSPINVPTKDSFQPVGTEVPLVLTSSKAKFLCLQLIGIFVHMLWHPKPLWSTLPYARHLTVDSFLCLSWLLFPPSASSETVSNIIFMETHFFREPPLRKLRVGGVWSWWSVWMTQLASGTRHECLLGGGTKWARVMC